MRVAELWIYPVKSTAGLRLDRVQVHRWGLEGDRRWAVVDPDGRVLTAHRLRRLLEVRAVPAADGGLDLSAPDRTPLHVAAPVDGPVVPVDVSRLDAARDAGEAAAAWFSDVLGTTVRLVWQDDTAKRSVGAHHGGRPGDPLNLADTGPILLTTTDSLRRLEGWVAETASENGEPTPAPLAMGRFRPSVVVDGAPEAFVEDEWKRLRIGDVELRFTEHCDRCALTTVDPTSLVDGKEPIRTLARHRKWDGEVFFGVRFVPTSPGFVGVGDEVVVC